MIRTVNSASAVGVNAIAFANFKLPTDAILSAVTVVNNYWRFSIDDFDEEMNSHSLHLAFSFLIFRLSRSPSLLFLRLLLLLFETLVDIFLCTVKCCINSAPRCVSFLSSIFFSRVGLAGGGGARPASAAHRVYRHIFAGNES